jgi:geranylgeranyl diphosphate synthase, type II
MHSFKELSQLFEERFAARHFPPAPQRLYDAAQYLLTLKAKRIRPVMCLMGNELFDTITPDAWQAAKAIELFHNFTLIHDDIMDKAPLRRGMPTVHMQYDEPTALLAGDVVLVAAYEYINKVSSQYIHQVLELFNTTARQVCEGQQLDMEFEKQQNVTFEDYVQMTGLKTSVLLAASLRLGGVLGGAGLGNQEHLYGFGKSLGLAFQVQDDYLDAFGDPEKFGKKPGGDIIANKKTFLLIQAMHTGSQEQVAELYRLMEGNIPDKIERVLSIYSSCKVDEWAQELKQKYFSEAMEHLDEIAVLSARKKPLQELALFLLNREL